MQGGLNGEFPETAAASAGTAAASGTETQAPHPPLHKKHGALRRGD
jgi:hypothetical protein